MSADNYLVIIKELDGKFRAYMQFASDETEQFERVAFVANTLEEAIKLAQEEEVLEYGYEVRGI